MSQLTGKKPLVQVICTGLGKTPVRRLGNGPRLEKPKDEQVGMVKVNRHLRTLAGPSNIKAVSKPQEMSREWQGDGSVPWWGSRKTSMYSGKSKVWEAGALESHFYPYRFWVLCLWPLMNACALWHRPWPLLLWASGVSCYTNGSGVWGFRDQSYLHRAPWWPGILSA
jgi:hypothetical protein